MCYSCLFPPKHGDLLAPKFIDSNELRLSAGAAFSTLISGGRLVLMRSFILASAAVLFVLLSASFVNASEAELVLPDVGNETFLGVSGRTLLTGGLAVCLGGAVFGLVMFVR